MERPTTATEIDGYTAAPIISRCQKEFKHLVEHFDPYQDQMLKQRLGEIMDIGHLSETEVNRRCTGIRKNKKYGVSGVRDGKGHGQPKTDFSKEYLEHLETTEYKSFLSKLHQFWTRKEDGIARCCICLSTTNLQGHHNNYNMNYLVGRGCETLQDVILVCKKCHKVCDSRRQREANRNGRSKHLW